MKLQSITYRLYEIGDLVITPDGVGTVEKVDIELREDGSFQWDEVTVKLKNTTSNGSMREIDSFHLAPITKEEFSNEI